MRMRLRFFIVFGLLLVILLFYVTRKSGPSRYDVEC
jgi:hypothetical protein